MKNNYRQCLALALTFALFTLSSPIISQNLPLKNISGTITDTEGPLSGVNILVKNTAHGSISDLDGLYSITATASDTLMFTYIGYKPQEVRVGATSTLNITMQPDATALDQVVINAGYYKVSDKEKTGSIARITASEIENQPVSNPLAAMQGRMAGVQVIQTSGLPGSGFKVQVRGKSSINAGNNPLYIIDGVPFNSQSLSKHDVSGNLIPDADLSPFSFLNPSDIESIEVLKDADATAIYGSRGANGVVLISIKKTTSGRTKYNITAKSGLGQLANTQKLLNTQQYLAMRKQAFENDGVTDYPAYAYDVNSTWSQDRYTDWQKELLGSTAYSTQYNALVSGGSPNTSFLLSGGYQKETTVFPGDYAYKRANGLAKIDHQSNEGNFKVSLSTAYTHETNNLPGSDLSYQALTLPPNAPQLYNSDGSLNWEEGSFNNPLAALEGEYLSRRNSLLVNGLLELKLFKGFSFKTNLGYQDTQLAEYHTYPHTMFNPFYGMDSSASAIYTNLGDRSSWTIEPQLTYTYKKDIHGVAVLVGFTEQRETSNGFSQYAQGFANNALIHNTAAASFLQVTDDAETLYKYRAIFWRINYTLRDRYIVNLTARRDGSSRFGANNRFANFGAVGAAWIFSEEEFVKNSMPFLNYGKLRGSYGTTGNDQIGDYRYLSTFSTSGIPYNGTIGLYPTALYNPNFGWEVNRKAELALEVGLLQNRLSTTVNYYNNQSSNQLLEVPLPGTTGFTGVLANLEARVANRGWEIELHSKNIKTPKWEWSTALNVTLPKNELLEFPDLENSTYANSYVIGEPITIKKVLQYVGVDPETGTYQFEDFNGDGQITSPEDSQYIVDTAPEYYGGLSNSIRWGALSLDVFLQFNKQKVLNNHVFGAPPGVMNNQPISALDAWTAPGDQATVQAYTSGNNPERSMAAYHLSISDAAYSNAAYLRLKNISLSYTLNNSFGENTQAKVFLQGQNLYTWTSFKGQDPEQSPGFLPPLRWMTAGLSVTF